MVSRLGDTEQAVLNILRRYGVVTMDEVLTVGKTDFTWNEVFLAVDRLSRKQLIVLSRIGSTYQLTFNMQDDDIGARDSTHGALAVSGCTGTRSETRSSCDRKAPEHVGSNEAARSV